MGMMISIFIYENSNKYDQALRKSSLDRVAQWMPMEQQEMSDAFILIDSNKDSISDMDDLKKLYGDVNYGNDYSSGGNSLDFSKIMQELER